MPSARFADFLFLAQDAAEKTGEGGGFFGGSGGIFFPMIMIFVIFYVLIIRPESKKRKAREAKVRQIEKGDQVLTNGGIYGTVRKIGETDVELEVDKNSKTRIRFSKNAIMEVLSVVDKPANTTVEADLADKQKS
jgi:preprotein translocase subunit YajC